ncbi:hypothetical protein AGDE_08371 [Angomonas deanei]|uniref:Uncharacterized protein n=1 Tax=Angomonas deanei TaxID=59799 RepID=A0A7G2CG69_9TRYP|nr:hypothetical protein AGDE_08371 [Angomonas deanei]CAD2218017.1 hypothetical protein, conserved [Angomonas deanei]|eukprot:EPY33062.1 hypothetical protein AGDE_08371 [Angomonas deanei]
MHNPGNSSGNVYVNEPYGGGRRIYSRSPNFTPPKMPPIPSLPSVGSLGTPNIGAMWSNSPQYYNAGNQYGYPQANNNNNNAALDPNIQLVPTRPLLKALSKVSKPNPPWCVGSRAGSLKVSEELSIFSIFNTSTEEEMKIYNQCVENISRVMREVWPQASLHPKGITAAVMAPKKEICNHLYAVHCDDLEGVKQFEELAIKQGFHLEFGTDNRGLPAVICTDCVSGVKSCITYGPEAEKKCKGTSDILRDAYSSTQSARDVLFVLLALLQQNRILDDGGLNQKLFSGEALAVMLLSVVNSYENNLLPDSGRILLDFFLTFGFVAYFNPVASSVTIKTMQPPRPRYT